VKVQLPDQYTTRVEMLPLIDIVFLLLVFFIYAMLSMAVHRGMEVELPVSGSASPEKEIILSVSVRYSTDGTSRVFVDEERVELAGLAALLKKRGVEERKELSREPGVLLFSDRRVTYQELFKVLDQINQSGLSRVSLQADVER